MQKTGVSRDKYQQFCNLDKPSPEGTALAKPQGSLMWSISSKSQGQMYWSSVYPTL